MVQVVKCMLNEGKLNVGSGLFVGQNKLIEDSPCALGYCDNSFIDHMFIQLIQKIIDK